MTISKMARPTKPGNIERGWNDPPVFLHTPTISGQAVQAPPTKRTLLNKRVAHPGVPSSGLPGTTPLDKNAPPPLFNPVQMGPPPASNVVLLPPSSTVNALPGPAPIIIPNMMAPPLGTAGETEAAPTKAEDDIEVPDFGDDNQMFLFVSSHLRRVLRECQRVLADSLSKEIERKLDVFEKMWESGRMSYQVKACMAKLSIALCRRQCDLAHEIHLALMMDYVSEVGQWMVGVKRLIQEARNIPAITSPDASQTAAPDFTNPDQGKEERDSQNEEINELEKPTSQDSTTDVQPSQQTAAGEES